MSITTTVTNALRREWQHLSAINKSDRSWQMPLAASLAIGLPLLVGAYFGRMDYGLISSLGGLVFLYLPETPLYHRMIVLLSSAFGMSASYALGVMSHFVPPVMMLVLTFISIVVMMICRFYKMSAISSLFFVMAAAIGAYSPSTLPELPLKVGLITLGCLLSCMVAFFYSLYMLRMRPAVPVEPLPPASFDFVVVDSVIIGVWVGVSLLLAQAFGLERAYWVPVSCLAVIQGMSLRAMWNKHVQRIVGTGAGLLLAWGLLALPFNNWSIAGVMMLLTFIVEFIVVRNYGFAAIFITPLTILLADAATLDTNAIGTLIGARFFDTVLGCLTGLAGGVCLHNPRFRTTISDWLLRLIPKRD